MKFYSFHEAKPYLRLLNRTSENEEGLCLDWCASGFECRFTGRAIRLYFDKSKSSQPVYIRAYLDGVCHRLSVQPTGDIVIFDQLSADPHFLRFIRITEPRDRTLFDRICLTRIDILGTETASFLDRPETPDRRIAILGDSITCGWGALAVENIGFRTSEEDVTCSYSYKTVQAFNADYQIVSSSGQGLVRECSGEMGYPLPTFFEHLSPFEKQPYDHSRWIPEVLVINIGTNDWAPRVPYEEFKKTGIAFLNHLRALYPKAKILWTYGMMGNPYSETIKEILSDMNGQDIFFLEKLLPSDAEHCSFGHPSSLGHDHGAQALIDKIAEITGWIPEQEWL